MLPRGVQVVCFCKYKSCNIKAVAHSCYPWTWFGGTLGCFALGPHRPLNLGLVSFLFLTRHSRLISIMVIKSIGKELGVWFRYHFIFLSQWFTTKHSVQICLQIPISEFFDEERQFIRVKWGFSILCGMKNQNVGKELMSWRLSCSHLLHSFSPPGNKDSRFGDYWKLWPFSFRKVSHMDFIFPSSPVSIWISTD